MVSGTRDNPPQNFHGRVNFSPTWRFQLVSGWRDNSGVGWGREIARVFIWAYNRTSDLQEVKFILDILTMRNRGKKLKDM